jgi:LPXTG-motif cell wall-anchored protein
VNRNHVHTSLVTSAALIAAVGVAGLALNSPAGAAQQCSFDATYTWSGEVRLLPWVPTFSPGITITPAAPGETLNIVSADYATFDRYPSDGSAGTRTDANQQNERAGISIGGVNFGALSTDVPNGPAEGAPDEYFSGIITGSFGSGPTAGGAVLVRHASLYGFTESPNSVNITSLEIVVERCIEIPDETTTTPPQPETTPTSVEPETTPAETIPTSLEPETTPPDSTPSTPETQPTVVVVSSVLAEGPEPTAGVQPSVLGKVQQELPATGSRTSVLVVSASLLLLAGISLMAVRRRPVDS